MTMAEAGALKADFKSGVYLHFELSEDGHITIDEDLHQQQLDENYLPPAAVFLPSLA